MKSFKKYDILFFLSCMFSTILHVSTYCMNTEQNCKNVKKHIIPHTIDKTVLLCAATLSQLTNVNGYAPAATQAACYGACAKNCSVDIPFSTCDITFQTVGIPLLAIGVIIYFVGCGIGFCSNKRAC